MDFKSKHSSPVLTDSVPVNNSRLGLTSNIATYSGAPTYSSSGLYSAIPRRKAMPSKIDDVRATAWLDAMISSSPPRKNATAWLDAMISSSPPRKKLNKDFMSESSFDEVDGTYMSWVVNYPSALIAFEQIVNHAKGKKIALFLDYDGTLSPIVDNPDCAFMSSAMRSAVKNVAKHFPTAIISGRSRDKVYEFVQLPELHYAGSHGMDIMGPLRESLPLDDHPGCIRTTDKQGKEVHLFQPASEFIPIINEVFSSLIEITKNIIGVKVENNKFCVSVHYRLVDGKNLPELAQLVGEFLKDYPSLRVTHGRKVLEVRPVIDWNKGKAVEFLLESLGFNNSNDVLPIYVGDDKTDEDAFKVLREGNRGFGILVSSVPKETNAFYSLRDTTQVMEFLMTLVKWKKSAAKMEANYTTTPL